MADTKISQLSSASTPLAGTEVLPIVQSSATVKVATNDLTVKNIRSNATTGILQIAGPSAAATRTMTVPDANFTSARTDAGQTFAGVQKFSSQAQAEATSATTWSATALNTDTFRSTNLSATANSFTAFGYQVTNSDGSAGYATTAAIASGSFSADWVVQNRNAGNFQENLRVKAAGDVTVNTGNLIVGTAGKGINFSANTHAAGMTSELLNAYEEGTWTPVIGGETSESGQSYTAQRGMYTKVGRMVTCTFDVVLATKGTITGDVALKGLPFTAVNNAAARYPACNIGLWQNLASGYVYINGVVIDNSTYAGLRGITTAATALAGFGTAAITDTTRFSGTVTYFTA